MLKVRCVERQQYVTNSEEWTNQDAIRWKSDEWIRFEGCLNCEQGKIIQGMMEDTMGTCRIDGCDENVKGQGLCNKHYYRWASGKEDMVKIMGKPFKLVRPARKKKTLANMESNIEETKGQSLSQKQTESKGDGKKAVKEDRLPELERVQRTIRVLVAAGIVTDEQVRHAYELVG